MRFTVPSHSRLPTARFHSRVRPPTSPNKNISFQGPTAYREMRGSSPALRLFSSRTLLLRGDTRCIPPDPHPSRGPKQNPQPGPRPPLKKPPATPSEPQVEKHREQKPLPR